MKTAEKISREKFSLYRFITEPQKIEWYYWAIAVVVASGIIYYRDFS